MNINATLFFQLVAFFIGAWVTMKFIWPTMVRSLEAAVVDLLRTFDVDAYGREDAPGVYVRRDGVEAKIAALGLKVRDGCSYHGLALNVDVDPEPYRRIDPCGFPGLAVTSLVQLGIPYVDDVEPADAAWRTGS